MEIHASTLAADIFDLKNWITDLIKQKIDSFHIDLIDPSFANFLGSDFKLIEKISELNFPFWIHYMATWNKELLAQIMQYKPKGIFLHQKHIHDLEFFYNINGSIALELEEEVSIDVQNYLLMNVKLGYCGQAFSNNNIARSHQLKKMGKTIATDGGITLENIKQVSHFDHIIIGSGLNKNKVIQFREQL